MTRTTRQRRRVLALLQETEEFCSAQQLHARLRQRDLQVGLTTVYRTLRLLGEAGLIAQVRLPSGELLFRRCDASGRHHHHLVCRGCGRTAELSDPVAESLVRELAAAHGYRDPSHVLEVLGTCPRCTVEARSGPAAPAAEGAALPSGRS